MEPDVRAFLILVMQSVSMVLLWMLMNMTAGVYFDLAFFEGHITIWNIVYYIFLLGTFYWLIIYLKKKWKGFKEV
jgi:Ca2+/Na+ antiporter